MPGENKDVLIGLVKFPTVCAGIWPRPLTQKPIWSVLIKAYSVLAIINFFAFYSSLIAELIRLIIHRYSTQIVLSSFSVCVNATKIAVKVIIYMKNNVLELYDDVINRERELWRKNDQEIIKVYFRKIQTGKLFRMLLWSSTIVVVIGLNSAGAYGMAQLIKYNEAHNTSLEPHYNYQFWFPGNKLEHRNWVYFINFLDSYAATMGNLTTHMALVTLLMYSASQLEILQYRLKHYIPEDRQEYQIPQLVKELKGLVKEHQYLIE